MNWRILVTMWYIWFTANSWSKGDWSSECRMGSVISLWHWELNIKKHPIFSMPKIMGSEMQDNENNIFGERVFR